MTAILDAFATTARLPPLRMADAIRSVLLDPTVHVPARLVQALPGGGSLFVMPALDGSLAITKLITFTPGNRGSARATIQGDVIVFDVATGERLLILDGPAVTACRTAAVSLLAARTLAPTRQGALLIVGAGAQGRSHLDAFAQGLQLTEVLVASRSVTSAEALAAHARTLGLPARVVTDPDAHVKECSFVVTCTPASAVVINALPPEQAFIAAVGAFTPSMVELSPQVCRHVAAHGRIVVDTADAVHEAGDLIQAGLDIAGMQTLADVLAPSAGSGAGPVLFKSCGWAGWDLAAARAAMAAPGTS